MRKPPRASPLPPVSAAQSKFILACLAEARLAPVSAASGVMWSGYDREVGKFVYVALYRTTAAASAQARQLSAESVGRAGLYVIGESIARYPGSPVPAVAGCLSGRPIKKQRPGTSSGHKHRRSFTF